MSIYYLQVALTLTILLKNINLLPQYASIMVMLAHYTFYYDGIFDVGLVPNTGSIFHFRAYQR